MLVSTEAIVLSYLKYSETSIIVKCFTQSDGLKSYLIKENYYDAKRLNKYWIFSTANNS